MFDEAQTVPNLLEGTQLHAGVLLTLIAVLIAWFVMSTAVMACLPVAPAEPGSGSVVLHKMLPVEVAVVWHSGAEVGEGWPVR